jgi:hypothetical protein
MPSNIEKYRSDLKSLIERGELLRIAMDYECDPKGLRDALASKLSDKKKAEEYLKKLPSFVEGYQPWYSEAKALVRQIIPDRLDDFVVLYERPKTRKQINYGNYVVYDYLQQLQVTRGTEVLVESSAAIPQFRQQLNIVKSAQARF